jgi:hypothetical protein
MTFFDLFKGYFSQPKSAMTIYRRGLDRANEHDNKGALADYSTVIDMDAAPADIRAMALYNRSVVHGVNHDDVQAVRDLERLLEMPAASAAVKTEARRKLLRMQRTAERTDLPGSR